MKKKLEIGLVAVLCLLLWATEMMTGWFSAHFPWELFAGIGIMSWVVQEVLKMVKAVKKEMEQ